MKIKELTITEFDNFAQTFNISTEYQTSNYALFMTENDYEYDLIGYIDCLGVIKAAALILIKKIGLRQKYGYSPRGFLIDYFDFNLLESFTNDLKNYYNKTLTFIKINPEIAIGEIDKYSKLTNYNQNIIIRDYLKQLNFRKLKDNLNFESIFPRFNTIINLKDYNFNSLNKNTKNKIKKGEKKGLIFEKTSREGLTILYNFIKNKNKNPEFFYQNYFNCFSKNDKCDLFLVKIDYREYLINSKNLYDIELNKNNELSSKLITHSDEISINAKMNSDKTLLNYKNDIEIATRGMQENKKTYIAGAIVTKHKNRIEISYSGYDPRYKHFNANYFLHYNILEYYKNDYKFADLNGISGDFKSTKYKGLNDFKLGFNPHIYEFIGEFDFIINEKKYQHLEKKGLLAKEFNKKSN